MGIFYMPKDGVCGDFIPYYNKKRDCYELYYLHDFRGCQGEGEGTIWRRIVTQDMVDFIEEGEILSRGHKEDQDLFCYTGCVADQDGLYHIYYTGHNHHFPEEGKAQEAVMHATSVDGIYWEKHPEDTFYAPTDHVDIERDDWRDPFVFYQEEARQWWMLLCMRKKEGPSRRRGVTGLLTSQDLIHWEYKEKFWDPHMCWCPECPDLFRWGEYWYFVYSTFSETEGMRTYYRISKSLEGPWMNPGNNSFDGRAFYAGKTASDGRNRYIFGWNPTKTEDRDEGIWQWGGNLVIHKLHQELDGSLTVSMPEKIQDAYGEKETLRSTLIHGKLEKMEDGFRLEELSGVGSVSLEKIPDECLVEFDFLFADRTDSAGIMLKVKEEGAAGYYFRMEPEKGRFLFDREPCYPHEKVEIERFAAINTKVWHSMKILLDGTCVLAYLDDKYALSARMYDFQGDKMQLFVNDGQVRIRNLSLRKWNRGRKG